MEQEKASMGWQSAAGAASESTRKPVSSQMTRWGEKMSDKMCQVSSQVKERTNKTVDRVTAYLRHKDTQEMISDLQQVVRKHPGKSLLAGLLVGMVVGRVIRLR